jgi:hypothetical protein
MHVSLIFDRLLHAVKAVARHAPYPGKDEAMELCMEDVDGLYESGRIDAAQWQELRDVLQEALHPTP